MDVVIITFPPDISEATVLWFKSHLEKIAGLIVRTKTITIAKGTKTRPNCFAFHLTASYQGYLRGLEMMQVPKRLKDDLGNYSDFFAIFGVYTRVKSVQE